MVLDEDLRNDCASEPYRTGFDGLDSGHIRSIALDVVVDRRRKRVSRALSV